jgi:hypothetical protein
MHKRLEIVLKVVGYAALYLATPIAMAVGLDFGDLEADIEDTIMNGKKVVVMIAFAGAVLTYAVTRNVKAVGALVGLIFLAAKGLEIALGYIG